jgi:hypothetical protein
MKDGRVWRSPRIKQYGFVESRDDVVVLVPRSGEVGGTPFKGYYGTLTMGKELAMVESRDRDRMIRRYCQLQDDVSRGVADECSTWSFKASARLTRRHPARYAH